MAKAIRFFVPAFMTGHRQILEVNGGTVPLFTAAEPSPPVLINIACILKYGVKNKKNASDIRCKISILI